MPHDSKITVIAYFAWDDRLHFFDGRYSAGLLAALRLVPIRPSVRPSVGASVPYGIQTGKQKSVESLNWCGRFPEQKYQGQRSRSLNVKTPRE